MPEHPEVAGHRPRRAAARDEQPGAAARHRPHWPPSAGWTSPSASGRSTPTPTATPRSTGLDDGQPGLLLRRRHAPHAGGHARDQRRAAAGQLRVGRPPGRGRHASGGPSSTASPPAGRQVTLDLRAKAITDDTVEAGLATGLPVVVNTKFWTEHQGLPYHATLLQEGDRYVQRHCYGDQLRYPGRRKPGAPRLPLPALEPGHQPPSAVGRSGVGAALRRCQHLGGSAGFEVCAPSPTRASATAAAPGASSPTPPTTDYRWEQERYWPWYAASSGAWATTATPTPHVWRREWAATLGPRRRPHVERALRHASGVLPLLTARHSPSASVFGYWPEKDTGGLLDLYLQVPGSDVGMFASAEEAVAEAPAPAPARARRRSPATPSSTLAARGAMGASPPQRRAPADDAPPASCAPSPWTCACRPTSPATTRPSCARPSAGRVLRHRRPGFAPRRPPTPPPPSPPGSRWWP